jgi:hypothetical protein
MKKIVWIMGIILATMLVASCAPPIAVTTEVGLEVGGLVERDWSMEDLQALPMTKADYTNKDGETTTFLGVSFSDLFEEAGISEYDTVTLIAADDYLVGIDRETLESCESCIIAIEDDGALRSVMPGMEGKLQVKDLVMIEMN